MIFMVNIKNFGLQYHSDQAITKTSLVGMLAICIMKFLIGFLIDKFGVRIIYRIIAGLTIVTVLVFYFSMEK
jgi:Na+/melibiose symporter-like transporter